MNRFDIVIVGGGIAGASLGAELAGKASVLILEREDSAGYHATGRLLGRNLWRPHGAAIDHGVGAIAALARSGLLSALLSLASPYLAHRPRGG
jgi:2-polyprenyl-6-methoxyphenol hydroxylase-like FAD-dependent oxidoreductase